MQSYSISPRVTFREKIAFYRQYVSQVRRTGHKPVSFLHYLKGRR